MADKNIGALTQATTLDDDSLLVAEQQGEAVSVSGALLKLYVAEAAEEALENLDASGGASVTTLDLTSVTVDSSASAFNGQSLTGDIGMTGDELYEAWLSGPVLVKYTDSAGGTVQTALVTAMEHTEGSAYEVFVSAMNAQHPTVPAALELIVYPEDSAVIGLFYPVASPMPDWTAEEGDINYIYGKPANVVQSVNGTTPDEDGNVEVEVARETITAISVTEDSDGTVTIVNTLEDGETETIVVTPDDSGTPATVTYNGTIIPVTWVVSE